MQKRKEDNVVFIVQQAIKRFKIKVSNTTIEETLMAHPHYPSLKSVCDAFSRWKVEHYPLSLSIDEIEKLELPFIAHLNTQGGSLIFVEKIKNGKISYFFTHEKKVEDFGTFSDQFSGAVVVLNKTANDGERNYRIKRQTEIINGSLLPICIFALLLLTSCNLFFYGNMQLGSDNLFAYVGLFICKILGIIASVFLILHEMKLNSPLVDKICGFSSKTDCDAVLSSNASKLFGWMNWADVGVIYFIASLIYLTQVQSVSSLWLLSIISLLALPYPIFSIYFQAIIVKKWCPFCLTVQIILITEFAFLFSSISRVSYSVNDFLILCVSFAIPTAIWLSLKAMIQKSAEFRQEHYSFREFKRNPEIFEYLLKSNGYNEFQENENSLILGNPDGKITVTAFLSLYCSPCADSFVRLKRLLENHNDIKINIVFSSYDNDESKKLISAVYYIYQQKGEIQVTDFLYQWYTTNKPTRVDLYKDIMPDLCDISDEINHQNKNLFEKNEVSGTPTIFLNGYKFPVQYSFSDIELHIDDIKNITKKSHKQETFS